MLVSHTHRFIFLKTKKTASTSVEAMLEPYCTRAPDRHHVSESCNEQITEFGIIGARLDGTFTRFFNHMPAAGIRNAVGSAVWNDYLKISTVRNPFDKMVSWYFWEAHSGLVDRETVDFSTWCLDQRECDDQQFLFSSGGFDLDVYLRFEHLEQDVGTLWSRLGIRAKPGRYHFKSGVRPEATRNYREVYSTTARRHIEDLYEPIIREFDYRF